jgi:hypothetical protein
MCDQLRCNFDSSMFEDVVVASSCGLLWAHGMDETAHACALCMSWRMLLAGCGMRLLSPCDAFARKNKNAMWRNKTDMGKKRKSKQGQVTGVSLHAAFVDSVLSTKMDRTAR